MIYECNVILMEEKTSFGVERFHFPKGKYDHYMWFVHDRYVEIPVRKVDFEIWDLKFIVFHHELFKTELILLLAEKLHNFVSFSSCNLAVNSNVKMKNAITKIYKVCK